MLNPDNYFKINKEIFICMEGLDPFNEGKIALRFTDLQKAKDHYNHPIHKMVGARPVWSSRMKANNGNYKVIDWWE